MPLLVKFFLLFYFHLVAIKLRYNYNAMSYYICMKIYLYLSSMTLCTEK
jgi:hypothetical protein